MRNKSRLKAKKRLEAAKVREITAAITGEYTRRQLRADVRAHMDEFPFASAKVIKIALRVHVGRARLLPLEYLIEVEYELYKKCGGGAVSVQHYGAVGDGVTDNTAAFQRAHFPTKK